MSHIGNPANHPDCCEPREPSQGAGAFHEMRVVHDYRFLVEGACVGEYQLHYTERGEVSLWSFEVYPQFQRRGYARQMIEEVIRRAGKRDIELLVKRDNTRAWMMYVRAGFSIIMEKVYENEYLMIRRGR